MTGKRTLIHKLGALIESAIYWGDAGPRAARNFMNEAADLSDRYMPAGSGFDAGTRLRTDKCSENRLVFDTSFHHMDAYGSYDGWTDHTVYVRATLTGFDIRVTGSNKNDIKGYIADTFRECLRMEID